MTTLSNDQEIFEHLKTGDMSACKACVDAHSDSLYRLAHRMLHNEQAAEDVVQDTFLNAFRGLEQFDGRSTLGTWLFRIAYNNALMRLRASKPTEALADDDKEIPPNWQPVVRPWHESLEELVERGEMRGMLDNAIDALPPTLRTVMQLRDLEERSTAETAEILNLSQTAVKVRLHRARLLLREKLSTYFSEETPPLLPTMSCTELIPYLSEYIDNAVDEPLAAAARTHIATCPHCHILLDTTKQTLTLLARGKPRVFPMEDRASLFSEIETAFTERRRRMGLVDSAA